MHHSMTVAQSQSTSHTSRFPLTITLILLLCLLLLVSSYWCESFLSPMSSSSRPTPSPPLPPPDPDTVMHDTSLTTTATTVYIPTTDPTNINSTHGPLIHSSLTPHSTRSLSSSHPQQTPLQDIDIESKYNTQPSNDNNINNPDIATPMSPNTPPVSAPGRSSSSFLSLTPLACNPVSSLYASSQQYPSDTPAHDDITMTPIGTNSDPANTSLNSPSFSSRPPPTNVSLPTTPASSNQPMIHILPSASSSSNTRRTNPPSNTSTLNTSPGHNISSSDHSSKARRAVSIPSALLSAHHATPMPSQPTHSTVPMPSTQQRKRGPTSPLLSTPKTQKQASIRPSSTIPIPPSTNIAPPHAPLPPSSSSVIPTSPAVPTPPLQPDTLPTTTITQPATQPLSTRHLSSLLAPSSSPLLPPSSPASSTPTNTSGIPADPAVIAYGSSPPAEQILASHYPQPPHNPSSPFPSASPIITHSLSNSDSPTTIRYTTRSYPPTTSALPKTCPPIHRFPSLKVILEYSKQHHMNALNRPGRHLSSLANPNNLDLILADNDPLNNIPRYRITHPAILAMLNPSPKQSLFDSDDNAFHAPSCDPTTLKLSLLITNPSVTNSALFSFPFSLDKTRLRLLHLTQQFLPNKLPSLLPPSIPSFLEHCNSPDDIKTTTAYADANHPAYHYARALASSLEADPNILDLNQTDSNDIDSLLSHSLPMNSCNNHWYQILGQRTTVHEISPTNLTLIFDCRSRLQCLLVAHHLRKLTSSPIKTKDGDTFLTISLSSGRRGYLTILAKGLRLLDKNILYGDTDRALHYIHQLIPHTWINHRTYKNRGDSSEISIAVSPEHLVPTLSILACSSLDPIEPPHYTRPTKLTLYLLMRRQPCCTHCWQMGHTKTKCPLQPTPDSLPYCKRCHQPPHDHTACPRVPCSICHDLTHSSYQCTAFSDYQYELSFPPDHPLFTPPSRPARLTDLLNQWTSPAHTGWSAAQHLFPPNPPIDATTSLPNNPPPPPLPNYNQTHPTHTDPLPTPGSTPSSMPFDYLAQVLQTQATTNQHLHRIVEHLMVRDEQTSQQLAAITSALNTLTVRPGNTSYSYSVTSQRNTGPTVSGIFNQTSHTQAIGYPPGLGSPPRTLLATSPPDYIHVQSPPQPHAHSTGGSFYPPPQSSPMPNPANLHPSTVLQPTEVLSLSSVANQPTPPETTTFRPP